ncbi:hypothetical protein [Bernardetia litoralis]|uniref:hypothetical protein n=1 Tax=Bernardetia litoralis TaxID=999 RepID=UPI0012FE226B|nr:hypothetical protein [Bernardetia litoralis]
MNFIQHYSLYVFTISYILFNFTKEQILTFRKAKKEGVSKIVEMIADELGKQRENFQSPLPQEYLNYIFELVG